MEDDLYYRPHLREPPAVMPFSAETLDTPPQLRTDLANHPDSVVECGFVLAPEKPAETEAQTVAWDVDAEAWIIVDHPPIAPDPELDSEPVVLGKGEFYDLVRASGVSFAQIKAASADPALEEFWFALNNFYTQIQRDHPSTRQGIAAMVALGHIDPAAGDQVFASWPVR